MQSKACGQQKPYTEFVTKIFNCISERFDASQNALVLFAEGSEGINRSGSQEYAVLRNDRAQLFYSILCSNMELFGIKHPEHELKISKIYPDEMKIAHSCYPKNVRRWLNGTISRKKNCRIEFCILAWCHAAKWSASFASEKIDTYDNYQKKLLEICNGYLDTQERELTVSLLWRTNCEAYTRTIAGK